MDDGFWRQVSLLEHHALEVPRRPGSSVHGHARLTWREGQLLGPLQSLHQVWVRPLCNVASGVEVWLPWVTDGGGAPVGLGHQVGWRNAALLHPGVHGSRVVHVAGHCIRPCGAMLGSSVMTVQVQDFFRAFGLLQVLFVQSFGRTADSAAGASIETLGSLTFSILWASRMRSYFRYRNGRQQRSTSGAFGANG